MDIKMLSKRYSTPMYVKVIGTILFPATVILMMILPVFELIPQEQYINVFNLQGVANGPYDATKYTMFTMMENDYGSGLAMGIMLTQCILAVIAGVLLLYVNRPKIAAVPAALIFWTIIFSIFRARSTSTNNVPAKLYTGTEFWTAVAKSGHPVDGDPESATGFVQQYTRGGDNFIFRYLSDYWILWVCGAVLIAFTIFAIVKTKTLIEKDK